MHTQQQESDDDGSIQLALDAPGMRVAVVDVCCLDIARLIEKKFMKIP